MTDDPKRTFDPKAFDWWKAKLAGEDVPIHADQAMQGFYAYKPDKKKPPMPVAFWYDRGGELLCHLDGKPFRNGIEIWLGCSRNPISHAVYKSVLAGEGWPEEIRITTEDGKQDSTMSSGSGIGHNSGDAPGDFTALTGNMREWIDKAGKVIKAGVPKTKEDADAVSDLATKLVELSGEADKNRLAETKPLRDKVDEINAKWNAAINEAKKVAKDLKTLVGIYIVEENKRRNAAVEAARAAAAAELAKNSTETAPADMPAIDIEAAPVRTGTRKAVSMVNEQFVVIDDRAKVFAYFAALETPPQDIMDAIERRTFGLLKNGASVPGARLDSRQKAR
jgi:hypothetical protein